MVGLPTTHGKLANLRSKRSRPKPVSESFFTFFLVVKSTTFLIKSTGLCNRSSSNPMHRISCFFPFFVYFDFFLALWIISRFSGGFRHFSTCLQILRIKRVNIIVLNEYWFDPQAFVYSQQRDYSHEPKANVKITLTFNVFRTMPTTLLLVV